MKRSNEVLREQLHSLLSGKSSDSEKKTLAASRKKQNDSKQENLSEVDPIDMDYMNKTFDAEEMLSQKASTSKILNEADESNDDEEDNFKKVIRYFCC